MPTFNSGDVFKETYNVATGTYSQSTLLTGFGHGVGIAIDSSLNLYVSNGSSIYKETYSSGSYAQTLIYSLSGTEGVAVDGSGNVYAVNVNTNSLYKLAASGYASTTIDSGGLNNPYDVRLDASGNLYVGSVIGGTVAKYTYTGGSYTKSTILSGIVQPYDVLPDSVGNLYFGVNNGSVYKATGSGTSYTSSYFYGYGAQAIALDSANNQYWVSYYFSTGQKVTVAPSYGSVAVGTAATPITVTFEVDTAGTLGTPRVLTQGASGLDFTLGSTTCSGSVSANTSCTVTVAFTPGAPGLRRGAVNLVNSSGTVIATMMVSGKGTGPLALFQPGVAGMTFSTTLNNPLGLSVDASGNVYVCNSAVNTVLKFTAAGIQSTLATQSVSTVSTAEDGAGNVYYASGSSVYELPGGNAGTGVLLATLPGGDSPDQNLSIDGAGDLFLTGLINGAIYEIPSGSSVVTTLVAGSSGRRFIGAALDSSGNFFAVDINNNILYELAAGATSLTTLTTSNSLNAPQGLAVDAADNVYISNLGGTYALRYAAGNYTAAPAVLAVNAQRSLAIGPMGTLYSTYGNSLQSYTRTTNPALAFASTAVGSTSSDSPRPVLLENDGNAALTISSIGASSANFTVVGAVAGSNAACGSTLATSAVCGLAASFTPKATGLLTGNGVVTDNTLNTTGSTQTVALSGTAVLVPTLTGVSPAGGAAAGGTSVTITGTALTSATAVAFGGTSATSYVVNSATQITAVSPASLSVGAVDVTVTTAGGTSAISAADKFTYAQNATTTILTTSSTTSTYGAVVTLTATVSNAAAAGTVTFLSNGVTVGTGTLSGGVAVLTATALPVGADSVSAVYGGDTTDTASTSNALVVTVSVPTTAVGSTSATSQVVFNFSSTVTLNATLSTAIKVVTQGATGLDFKYAASSSPSACAAGATYTSGQSCTVNFSFTPATPGVRLGGVGLYSNAVTPALVASTFLSGTGTGPQALFSSPVVSIYASGFSSPKGIAFDGIGNLYVCDQTANTLTKIAAGTKAQTVLVTAIAQPSGVAVDGLGNIFYGANAGNEIYELVGGSGTPVAYASVSSPQAGLVVDGAGNLYSALANSSTIVKIAAGTRTQTNFGTGLSYPYGVALDAAGNMYVADQGNNRIAEISANGSTTTTLATVTNPVQVTLDSAGNIYAVGFFGTNIVSRIAAGTYAVTVLTTNVNNPIDVKLDPSGNLYISNANAGNILELARSAANPIALPNTAVGSASAATTLTMENDGNASLVIASIAPSSTNFGFVGAVVGSSAACGSTLASAGVCGLSATFTPQAAGALAANGIVTDNTLNAAGSTQTVALSGTGTQGTKTISFPQPGTPVVAGTSVTLSATTSDGDPVTFAVTSDTATISGTTTVSGTTTATIVFTNAGSVQITASSAATVNAAAATPVADTVTVTAAPTTSIAPTTAVGMTSATQTVSISMTTAGTPSAITVSAQGNSSLDYAFVSGGSCSTTIAYTVGQACTVEYTFAPVATGIRYGAVTLSFGSTVLGTSYLSGSGTGAVAGFTQSAISGVADGIPSAQLTAMVLSGGASNASGNGNVLYVPTYSTHTLYKYTIGTGATLFYNGGSGAYQGAAVDAAGSVYVSDFTGNQIYKLSTAGALLATWPASGVALSGPAGMVFGTDGTLYVANATGRNIIAITTAGVASVVATTGYTFQVYGLTIDGANNLYLADQTRQRILEVAGNGGAGGAATVISVTGTALSTAIFGVAIDSAGYLYVTESSGSVLRITPAGVSSIVAETGLSNATGVTTDNRGHVYVNDQASSNLFTLTLASPPALALGNVAVGGTSAAQTETLFNAGNANLTIASVSASSSSFGFSGSTCGATLASGISCDLSATFTPQGTGALSGAGNVTDNALNVPAAVQSVVLAGTGTAAQPTVTSISPTTGPAGTTVTVTGTNLLGTTAVQFGAANATSFTVVSATSLTAVSPAGSGTVDVTVGNGTYTSATSPADQFTYRTAQTISFVQPASPATVQGTATLAATGGGSGSPVTFSIVSGPASLSGTNNATIVYTGVGTVVIAANQAGSASYLAAVQVTRTVTVANQEVFVMNSGGSVASYYNSGAVQTAPINGGGIGAAVDASGYVWSINASNGNGVSKFTDTGVLSVSYSGAGINAATALAVDGNGSVWIANGTGTISALTNAGVAMFTSPIGAAGNNSAPSAISVDESGSLWIANAGNNTVTEVIGVATPVATPTVTQVINSTPGTRP